MRDKIFLITPEKTLQQLEASTYASEYLLQQFLTDYPDLLAGHQMDESNPRRWLLVAREMGIADEPDASSRWSLDHLFLDQDGKPTLVEVKRASDTRIRREVAGQMLDYAANALLHWSPDAIKQRYEENCKARGIDPTADLARFLEVSPDDNESLDRFWEVVNSRLRAGQIRLVFVADQIPKELRRIIEFLNEHMPDVEVLGVELKQYVGVGVTTIVPRVIGQTSAAEQVKTTSGGHQWDEPSFFEDIQKRHPSSSVTAARRILEWAITRDLRIWWGAGKKDGSYIPVLDFDGQSQQLFVVFTYGRVELQFQRYHCSPFDNLERRRELADRLNHIDGVSIVEERLTKRPSIELRHLVPEENMQRFLAVYDWFLEELKGSTDVP